LPQTSPPTVLPEPEELPSIPDSAAGPAIPAVPPAPSIPDPLDAMATEAPPDVPAVARPPAWSYSMDLGVGFDDNIDASLTDGPSAWGAFLTGNVAYRRFRPYGQFQVSARGAATDYPSLEGYDRADLGGLFSGSWRPSASTVASFSAGYTYGHTDNSSWLSGQGLVYGLGAMQTFEGSAGFAWRLASRTSLRFDVRGVQANFEAESLSESDSLRAWAGLTREVSTRDEVGFDSAWERTGQPEKRDTLFASVHWRRSLSVRTFLFVEGGISQTSGALPGELARDLNFFGGASLHRRIGGRSVLEAVYRHEVVPVFGIGGVRLVDRWTLGYAATLSPVWSMGLSATYSREPDPESEGSFPAADAHASVTRRLGRRFSVSAAGRYRRAEFPGVAVRETYRAGAYVSWESAAR
jgi:hypothetical protein